MVSTRQTRGTRKSAEEAPSVADCSSEYEEQTPEPSKARGTKRARTSKATAKDKQQGKRRKQKAKLSMLPDMPVDILYEIFSLVHPRDLMRISWTSKILNKFLTRKSSRSIWQASFRGIPESEWKPPRCPSGITEMAYAKLLYGRHCMNCADANGAISAWSALVRVCGPCVQEIAIDLSETRTDGMGRGDMLLHLPVFEVRYTHRGVVQKVLRSDSERFSKELAAARKSSRDFVLERWRSLTRKRGEFSNAMIKFERLEEQAKEEARADIQERRIERIWEKLSEDGWHEEIAARKSEYESGLLKIKGVVMARPLGEKAWADLREPLNKFMKAESRRVHVGLDNDRCRSRIEEFKDILHSFRSSLPHPHDFSPSGADVCWIPEVRKAIVDGTDEEVEACEAEIRSKLPELSTTWLEERRNTFLELLPQDSPSLEHLSLATTLFDCMRCHKFGMRIEEALSHKCQYYHDDEYFAKFPSNNIANVFYYDVGAPWNSGLAEYRYSAQLSALVREVVVECGEDPDTITTKEMNRKHHRFACFGVRGEITVLSWFEAFEHRRNHGNTIPCRFLRADELPEYVPDRGDQRGVWGCLRCRGEGESGGRYRGYYFSVLKDHLAKSHQIENPTEDDYYNSDPNHTVPFKYKAGNST